MSYDVSDMISDLAIQFGRPKFKGISDQEYPRAYAEFLKVINPALRIFTGEELKKAAEILIATRKYRSFPLVSECREACVEAAKALKSERPRLLGGNDELRTLPPDCAPHRENLANELVMTALGRRAAREGWISALWQFIRKEMRVPNEGEIQKCIADAKGVDEWTERASRGECGAQSLAVMRLGESMLKRRDELKAMVLEGVLP
jgi:hypothetical protein